MYTATATGYPLEHQTAYQLRGSTPDGEYRSGDRVFTVPFEIYRVMPNPGDDVMGEHDGVGRFGLWRAIRIDAGIVLTQLVLDDGASRDDAEAKTLE